MKMINDSKITTVEIAKYLLAMCHEVLRTWRFEVRSFVQKLIQFSRIDLRFSGCGKTLKENCLILCSISTSQCQL